MLDKYALQDEFHYAVGTAAGIKMLSSGLVQIMS